MNRDLSGILGEAESKFRLKKIPLVLRAVKCEDGIVVVRAEKADVS